RGPRRGVRGGQAHLLACTLECSTQAVDDAEGTPRPDRVALRSVRDRGDPAASLWGVDEGATGHTARPLRVRLLMTAPGPRRWGPSAGHGAVDREATRREGAPLANA